MSKLIEHAETKGCGKLDIGMLDQINWVTPGERRWMAARNFKLEKVSGTIPRGNHGEPADRAQKEN